MIKNSEPLCKVEQIETLQFQFCNILLGCKINNTYATRGRTFSWDCCADFCRLQRKNPLHCFSLFLLMLSTGLVVLNGVSQQISVTLSVWCINALIVALIAIILDNHSICLKWSVWWAKARGNSLHHLKRKKKFWP